MGDEDPDSNDENYYANDYPDEPSDNESSDNWYVTGSHRRCGVG